MDAMQQYTVYDWADEYKLKNPCMIYTNCIKMKYNIIGKFCIIAIEFQKDAIVNE